MRSTGEIRIRRDVVRGHVQPPKSKKGKRTIKVPSDLKRELVSRSRYALLRPEMVFTDYEGKVHRGHPFCLNQHGEIHTDLSATLEKPITGACRKAELRRITHRDLRHTYASHLRLKGVKLEDIQVLLGHSSIQMVQRYAHIDSEKFAEAAAALELIGL